MCFRKVLGHTFSPPTLRWVRPALVVALLGPMPGLASAQVVLTPELSIGGNITFTREESVTQFKLAEPQAKSLTIRIVNERLGKKESLSSEWATALLQSRDQTLRLFSPEDIQIGYEFKGVNTTTAAGCSASAENRTSEFSSYVLRCIADSEARRARSDSGTLIYEIDIFLYQVTNNSDLDRFLLRASLPGRYALLVFLR